MPKVAVFSNTDWYLYNYRVPIDSILRDHGWDSVMISPGGPFVEKIRAAGFQWRELQMSRDGINPWREWKVIRSLSQILRQEQPDILHTFTMKGNINGGAAAALAHVPHVVHSIAGLGFVYSSDSLRAKCLRIPGNLAYRAVLGSSHAIFQNRDDQESFIRKGMVPRKRTTLIRSSGADTRIFSPSNEPEGIITVLFAARLLWTKGVGDLIEAARIVAQHGLKLRFLMAGAPDPGNPASISERQIEEWKKEGIVDFLGFRNDMRHLFAMSHIVCFPSRHREGVPKFLVEAASCGLPIITTDNPGCCEIVRDQETGLIVPPAKPDILADAILKLASNSNLRKAMGQAGRSLVIDHFSLTRVTGKTEELYRQLLG